MNTDSLRNAYMKALIEQDVHFFEIRKIGTLMSCLTDDIPKIQDVYTNEFNIFMQEIFQFIVAFILSMTCNWQMTLILVSTTPIMFCSHTIMSILSTHFIKKLTILT